jgi:hypothetical protein
MNNEFAHVFGFLLFGLISLACFRFDKAQWGHTCMIIAAVWMATAL